MSYRILKFIFRPLIWLFFWPKVTGKENINNLESGSILICNHILSIDCVLLAICCKKPVHNMAKSELFQNKIIAFLLHSLNAYSVSRASADLKSIKHSMKVIENKEICGIFPEGTRSKTGELLPFEKGVAFLAIKLSAPVVPAYIAKKRVRGRTQIIFGKPIDVKELICDVEKNRRIDYVTEHLRNQVLLLSQEVAG